MAVCPQVDVTALELLVLELVGAACMALVLAVLVGSEARPLFLRVVDWVDLLT